MENQKKAFSSKKILNLILFGLFTLFAILQLNDKDGVIWFSIYGVVALVHLYSVVKSLNRVFLLVLLVGLSVYCLAHISYFVEWVQLKNKSELFGEMVYEKPYLEGTREFLGLLIAIIALLFQWKGTKRK